MRHLNLILPAAAVSALAVATPAAAQQPFGPATFQNLSNVFNAADLDRNGALSSREYVLLRTGTIDRSWLRSYPGHAYNQVMPSVVAGFSRIDTNDNASLSRQEFVGAVGSGHIANSPDNWDWRPEYMSATYYLIANRIDADSFNGRKVMNLDGRELGTIRDVMRHEETGDYYALVTMSERVMDPTPSQLRAKLIGVPLDDLVLDTISPSLMLTKRGERYFLRDPGLPSVDIDELDQVDILYAT